MSEQQKIEDLKAEPTLNTAQIENPNQHQELKLPVEAMGDQILTPNIAKKFEIQYKNEEFNKFKNDILSIFKENESYFNSKIYFYRSKIESSEKRYEELIKLMNLNYQQVLSSQASLNNRLDKFNTYEPFVLKTNDILTSHEVRINNLIDDFSKFTQKYDKIYLDNLELPGFIGRYAKFKNCQSFFADVIRELNKLNTYKEKNTIDLKNYKEKWEQSLKSFRTIMDNKNEAQVKYINKLSENNMNDCKTMIDSLNERVTELRLENSKYSVDIINKTNEIKEQMNKIKEMKGELLNEFYNKVEEQKNISNKVIKNFNEFKNEYCIIRKKFLELADFIKDIRFKKNAGVDINKKDISSLYKNLVKKKKKNCIENNMKLLDNIDDIEKMKFNSNSNANFTNKAFSSGTHLEKPFKGIKKYKSCNSTKNIFKETYISLSGNNFEKKDNPELNRNINSFFCTENGIKYKLGNDNKLRNFNHIDGKMEFIEKMKSKKNIINKEMTHIGKFLKKNAKEDSASLIKENSNISIELNRKDLIGNHLSAKIEQDKNESSTKVNEINDNTEILSPNIKIQANKAFKKQCERRQIVPSTGDTLSISDSFLSICNSNNVGLSTNDKNTSNISIPLTYNINNVKCNKFVLNDVYKNENDNKIIKELASELEQTSAKKIKKLGSHNKSQEEFQKKIINKIEPINLINDKMKENEINNEKNDIRTKGNISNGEKIEIFSEEELTSKNNLANLNKTNSIIIHDNENKEISNLNDNTENNFNSYMDNSPEQINKKLQLFNKKLLDIESFMKDKFFQIINQIDVLKNPSENNSRGNSIQKSSIGIIADQNYVSIFNNDNNHEKKNLSERKEKLNGIIHNPINSPKMDIYNMLSSDSLKSLKITDNLKENILSDKISQNQNNKNTDTAIKNFIEKKININSKTINKDYPKKKIKDFMKNKNFNSSNGTDNDENKNSQNQISSSGTNGLDLKWINLNSLVNKKMPKSTPQKLNPQLSGEQK